MAYRLLAVLAHPDDESFGPGGTLAYYARKGVEVYLICATRGEEGDIPPDFLEKNQDIAALRESELQCAANILGIKEVHFLDYRDSGMAGSTQNGHPDSLHSAPVAEVAAKITSLIRKIKPQVVITFDPIGGYRHPDHIAIHKAAVAAFKDAGDPHVHPDGLPAHSPQKLYYHTFPRRWLRWMVRLMPLLGKDPKKWGRNEDIDMTAIASEDFPIHARIPIRSVAEIKKMASACHRSQISGRGSTSSLLNRVIATFNQHEDFMCAVPACKSDQKEKDLFSSVIPD